MIESNADRLGVVAESESDRGTPAEVWADHGPDLPPLDPSAWTRVVVVAPHPDDEVLGVGALAAALAGRGVEVVVIAVTDGTAAYPMLDPDELAAIRTRESEEACAVLGLAPPRRMALPDGAVAGHEDRLAGLLADHLGPGDTCLATWRGDGHPDHEATGRAAARACATAGATLVEYPVWMWHWAQPGDPRVPWSRAYGWGVGEADLARKREAVARFTSQLEPPAAGIDPILPPFVIDRLVTPREVVFT
ncbi:PIG-L deacetylase family protein [Mariniluteicoccus flavus]